MHKPNIPKLTVHQKAQIIKDNQHLYSKQQLLNFVLEWEKDYHNYLTSNLHVLSSL
tara:strand:+ start:484 stop:651 length:168 start_codon:yes stop_codon:yes gene_type:complete